MNPYTYSQPVEFDDGDLALDRSSLSIMSLLTPGTRTHTVLPGETVHSIAFKYYGDSGRWADICDVNSIYDPWTELEAGKVIYIPV